jgi:hypothetical protein
MDQVLHTDHAVFAKVFLDDLVVGERETLLVNLAVSSLVDELANRLLVWVSVGNEGLDDCIASLAHVQLLRSRSTHSSASPKLPW